MSNINELHSRHLQTLCSIFSCNSLMYKDNSESVSRNTCWTRLLFAPDAALAVSSTAGTRFLCQGSRGQTGCITNGMYPPSPHPMWRGLRASIGALFGRLPAGLLFVAVLLSAFSYGVATIIYEIFPYRHIAEGLKTYHIIAEGLHTGRMMFKAKGSGPRNALHAGVSSSIAAREAAANRIELLEGDNLSDPVLWFGGAWQFTDVCPGYGCLAVAFDTNGKVAHAWPWRPHEMERAATSSAVGGGAERALPSPFAEIVYPFAMAQYANGHLLVVLHGFNSPADLLFSLGLARIDAKATPCGIATMAATTGRRCWRTTSRSYRARSTGTGRCLSI